MKSIKKEYFIIILFSVFAFTVFILPKVESEETIEYIALGDSIAEGFGLNEEENSYVDLIGEELNAKTINLAKSGQTSNQLLEILKSGEYDNILSDADIITISIGSNDLLKPFIAKVTKIFGVEDVESIDRELIENLIDKYTKDPVMLIQLFTELYSTIYNDEELYNKCDEFSDEIFPSIISRIREVNDDALIIVNNIYNPYNDVSFYGIYDLGDIAEKYIDRINQSFKNSSDYYIADVYNVFKNKGLTNSYIDLKNLDMIDLDPHPNKDGHMMIFSEVNKILNAHANY